MAFRFLSFSLLLLSLPAQADPAEADPLHSMTAEAKLALSARWDLGYYLFQIQEYRSAASEFEKVRRILPADASLLALIGSCHAMSGRWREGESALMQARALSPDDPDINNILGQLFLSRGQALKGAVYLEKSLKQLPEQEEVRARLVAVYMDAAQFPQARLHLETLLAARGGEEFGEAELEIAYARCLVNVGDFRNGLRHAQLAHAAQPSNPLFARVLGQCLLGTNRFIEAAGALETCRAAISVDPEVYLQLGEALFLGRKWEQAENVWVEGARKFPASYGLLSRLMEYYLGTARVEQSRRVVGFAERHNPGHPGNLLLNSRLDRKLSSYSNAWKTLVRLKRQACGSLAWDALWEEAQLAFETGRESECGKALDRLIASGHRPAEAHLLKARMDLRSGRRGSAQAHILEARKLNPYNLKVYSLAKEAFSENQDRDRFAGMFQEALDLMPDSDFLYAQSEGILGGSLP